jgi:hypothetical protein
MGPLDTGHPIVIQGQICQGCKRPLLAGEFVTLVVIGPGDDEDSRQRRDEGRPYNATAIPVHWDCSTQETEPFEAAPV